MWIDRKTVSNWLSSVGRTSQLIHVTGLLGTGKTSLIRHYLTQTQQKAKWHTCVRMLNISTILGAKDASLEEALETAARSWESFDRIVWDDLHFLKPDVRYQIIQFIKGTAGAQKHILISEENLSSELGFEVPSFVLPGFTAGEVEEFLQNHQSQLDATALFKKTGGVPLLLQMILQTGGQQLDPEIWIQSLSRPAEQALRTLSLLPEGIERRMAEKLIGDGESWDELLRKNLISLQEGHYIPHTALLGVLEKWSTGDSQQKLADEILKMPESSEFSKLAQFRLALASRNPTDHAELILKTANSDLEGLSAQALSLYQNLIVKAQARCTGESLFRLLRLELTSQIYLGERKQAVKLIQQHLTPDFFENLSEEKIHLGYEAIYWLMRSGQAALAAVPLSLLINKAKSPVKQLLAIEQALPFVGSEPHRAIEILNRGLGNLHQIEDSKIRTTAEAQANYLLATAYYAQENFEQARTHYLEAQKKYQQIHNPYFAAFCSLNLAWIYFYLRRWFEFQDEVKDLKDTVRQFGYRYLEAGVYLLEALLRFEEGGESEALRLVSRAESQSRQMQIKKAWEDAALEKVKILLQLGQQSQAHQLIEELKNSYSPTDSRRSQIKILENFESTTLDQLMDLFPKPEDIKDPFWKLLFLRKHFVLAQWQPVTPREQLLAAELALSKASADGDENLFRQALQKIEHCLERFPEPNAERIALMCARFQNEKASETRAQILEMAEMEWTRWPSQSSDKKALREWIDSLRGSGAEKRLPKLSKRWSAWIYQMPHQGEEYTVFTAQEKVKQNEKPDPLKTGLHIDEASGEVFIKAKKIKEFSNKPVLRQILIQLVESYPVALSKGALSAAVWGEAYSPQVHDSRVYTSIQRIRTLLKTDVIENWEQGYRLSAKLPFQLVRTPQIKARSEDRIQSLVLEALRKRSKLGDGWMKKSDLLEMIGTTDSTLKRALASLLEQSLIQREGQGPAVKYKWKS